MVMATRSQHTNGDEKEEREEKIKQGENAKRGFKEALEGTEKFQQEITSIKIKQEKIEENWESNKYEQQEEESVDETSHCWRRR